MIFFDNGTNLGKHKKLIFNYDVYNSKIKEWNRNKYFKVVKYQINTLLCQALKFVNKALKKTRYFKTVVKWLSNEPIKKPQTLYFQMFTVLKSTQGGNTTRYNSQPQRSPKKHQKPLQNQL